jgi:hypothetical protein
VDDSQIHRQIEALVAEEHKLWTDEANGGNSDEDSRRLAALKTSLDQSWDLLRQRRALRETGADPDSAETRDERTVENYEQ